MPELKYRDYNRLHDEYYDIVVNGELRRIARHQGSYSFELPPGSLTERIDKWRENRWQVQHGIISPQDYIEQGDQLMQEITVALEELVWQLEVIGQL